MQLKEWRLKAAWLFKIKRVKIFCRRKEKERTVDERYEQDISTSWVYICFRTRATPKTIISTKASDSDLYFRFRPSTRGQPTVHR